MTINIKSKNEVIIYALENIIEFARGNQYILLAQSMWWISSIVGLQQGLIAQIVNLQEQLDNAL